MAPKLRNRWFPISGMAVPKVRTGGVKRPGIITRTILNIEAGRGNPKFDNLCSLVTYLNLSADDIFYPDSTGEKPIIQKLSMLLNGCSEQEAEMLIPAVRYLLSLIRQQDNCQ